MKIAELKAEIMKHLFPEEANASEADLEQLLDEFGFVMDKTIELDRQSLSRQIAEDVGKCENDVNSRLGTDINGIFGKITDACRSVPEPQKCEGCKRLLKLQKEVL